ncbi:hypothetical protein Tco_1210686 [Tanacetum coccineum]
MDVKLLFCMVDLQEVVFCQSNEGLKTRKSFSRLSSEEKKAPVGLSKHMGVVGHTIKVHDGKHFFKGACGIQHHNACFLQCPGGRPLYLSKEIALEILKKFGTGSHLTCRITPMVDRLKLDEDLMGIPVDQTRFRGMEVYRNKV